MDPLLNRYYVSMTVPMVGHPVEGARQPVERRQRLPRLRPVRVSILILVDVTLFHSIKVSLQSTDPLWAQLLLEHLLVPSQLTRQHFELPLILEANTIRG